MSPAGRFLLVGLFVAAGEAVLGILLLGTVLAGYFFGCAAASLAVAVAARGLFVPPPPGRGEPPADELDPDPDPPWWPAFEADLRRYERDRERISG